MQHGTLARPLKSIQPPSKTRKDKKSDNAINPEFKSNDVPGVARGTPGDLRTDRQALVSGVLNIPDEILRQVFAFVVFDEDGNHNSTDLFRLCSVSRPWRRAAIEHCLLWIKPLPIIILRPHETRIRNLTLHLRLYLDRSGTLPISFDLTILARVWRKGTVNAMITGMVQALVDHCHRWDKVRLCLPLSFYNDDLSSIRGRIPLLSELKIDTNLHGDERPPDDASEFYVGCFADAPLLCKVDYDVRYAFQGAAIQPSVAVHFDLPWSQLVKLKSDAPGNTSYHKTLESLPTELRELEIYAQIITKLPTEVQRTLPKLEKLVLRALQISGDILNHLGTLTLPSLKHLELRGFSTTPELFDKVLALIRRSQCSLEHLCLYAATGSASSFSKILALSLDITELYLCAPKADNLEALLLDPLSPDPVLPNLKILTILDNGMDDVTVDAAVLNKVAKSRTEGLGKRAAHGMVQALEEVNLLCNDPEMLQRQISSFELANTGNPEYSRRVPTSFEKLAVKASVTFFAAFGPLRQSGVTCLVLKKQVKVNKLLTDLEHVNLEGEDSRILQQRGIPYLLAGVSASDGRIPGDSLFRFRSRAGKLCKKWKPFLVREAHPYVWSHGGKANASIRWHRSLKGPSQQDEEIWKMIIGDESRTRAIPFHSYR